MMNQETKLEVLGEPVLSPPDMGDRGSSYDYNWMRNNRSKRSKASSQQTTGAVSSKYQRKE